MNEIAVADNCYDADKRELNLSHRNLRELDTAIIAAYGECTEYLDVSHNRIARLEWLCELPHLKCLIMDDNRLREAHFEKLKKVSLPKITTLTLNKNELSDLDTTANILQQTFPNLEYLSLHGNPMCPDNLYLQPFSEFVPYEYTHYRTVLNNSLARLKFLDHFSLESFHSHPQTVYQVNHHAKQKQHHEKQHTGNEQLPSTSSDLWSKIKGFLNVQNYNSGSSNADISALPSASARGNCFQPCAPCYDDSAYRGIHSEGNRFITNSDL